MTVDYSLGRTALAIQSLREPAAPLACVPNTIRQSIADVIEEQAAEISELKRKLDGYQRHLHECEQIAGKALGYPWYKDDQKNFPGATEADGVCVGEHVGDTIVAELAKRYEKTRNALENVVIAYGMGWDMDGVIGVAEEVLGLKKENTSS